MWASASCYVLYLFARVIIVRILTCAGCSPSLSASQQRVKWTTPPAISAADLVCLIAGVETRREASVVVSELKDRLLASNAVAYCTIKVSVRILMTH